MRQMFCTSLLAVSIGLVTSQGVTWASPDGSRTGEGAGWLQQNPSITKTPNWVPGPGKKLLEVTPRQSGPFTKNQVRSKANATPIPIPGPRSVTGKTRVVRRDASRLAPGPNSSPVPQPLPTPSKAGIVRRPPPPSVTPVPLPLPRPDMARQRTAKPRSSGLLLRSR